MLGRLDDALEDKGVNSNLPQALSGEPINGITQQQSRFLLQQEQQNKNQINSTTDSNNSNSHKDIDAIDISKINLSDSNAPLINLTHNIYPGARPILTNKTARTPLSL